MSKVYSIHTTQLIPAGLEEVWDFFSRPGNLANITPPDMKFQVLSVTEADHMYPGQVIDYKVRPVAGIAVYWMTEITQVKDLQYFIDEQRVGPYRLWHHQHHFKEIPGGVEMTDIVHYKLPFGWLGDLAHTIFVKKRLQEIFNFRWRQTEHIFGEWRPATHAPA